MLPLLATASTTDISVTTNIQAIATIYIMGQSVMEKMIESSCQALHHRLERVTWVVLMLLSGCASFSTVQSCNEQAYQQAPPVYDPDIRPLPRSCAMGIVGGVGPHSNVLGMTYDPFVCDQIMQSRDVNFDARRAIFGACMKGQVATDVPYITPAR
jgi:hypothetical protein